jgi:NADH-quinone oxidoreductase subunit N
MDPVLQAMFRAILAPLLVVLLGLVVLVVDLVIKREYRRYLGWVTFVGLGLIAILTLWLGQPGKTPMMYWGGMIRQDWMSFVFTILFLFAGAITALFAMDVPGLGDRGEFYLLMLASLLGMIFLSMASDLIMIYLSLEMVAIPLYVLAGFYNHSDKSTEAGFKYLLFGAMTSAISLYGLVLLYGFSGGTTNLYMLLDSMAAGDVPVVALVASMLLVFVGFAFKISSVPLHFWAPDVYEGAPTPVTGFLSTASKAAGFAVLTRVFFTIFPEFVLHWGALLTALAIATMTLGNLLALAQKNIKRMLAYSSIAHAGYALIGVVSMSELGITSLVYYLIAYVVTNLAAFGVVSVYSRAIGSDEIKDYAGMSRRAPGLALVMLVSFLSLAGMPPLAGFMAKFLVFSAAVNANMVWLAVIGVLNSIIGLYYYLTVLKVAYLYRSEDEDKPVMVPRGDALALWVLVIGIVLVGTVISPWFNSSFKAALAMFT